MRFGIKPADSAEPNLSFDEDTVHEAEADLLAERIVQEQARRANPVGQIVDKLFGGSGGVAVLPAAPVGAKHRVSKRRARRLRGKAKAK